MTIMNARRGSSRGALRKRHWVRFRSQSTKSTSRTVNRACQIVEAKVVPYCNTRHIIIKALGSVSQSRHLELRIDMGVVQMLFLPISLQTIADAVQTDPICKKLKIHAVEVDDVR